MHSLSLKHQEVSCASCWNHGDHASHKAVARRRRLPSDEMRIRRRLQVMVALLVLDRTAGPVRLLATWALPLSWSWQLSRLVRLVCWLLQLIMWFQLKQFFWLFCP